MTIFRKFIPLCFAFASCTSFAADISGPEIDGDGDFTVSWDPLGPDWNCRDLTISASQEDYNDVFAIEDDATEFRFTGLPEGEFIISLAGECLLNDTDKMVQTAISATKVSVKYSSDELAKNSKNISDILSIKSQNANNQADLLRAATSGPDGMWRCSTFCPSGYHIEWQTCNAQIVDENNNLQGCNNYLGLSGCLQTGSTNSVWCRINDDDFWACGFSCPAGYNRVDTRSNPGYCESSNTESRCVLNTDPPRSLSLEGPTTRYDATVQVSWGSVSNVSYYQWKRSTHSSWTRTSNRNATISNLANGSYTIQARACNSYGCSATSSRTVTLRSPAAPSITSSATSTTAAYRLSWSAPSGASRYEWKVNSGSWSSTTGTAVNTPNQSAGTHVFHVRACNSVICGSTASKSVTFRGPAAPTITSSTSNSAQYYRLTWSASTNATRYEWRTASGSWKETTGTSVNLALATGSNVLSVRACNSLGCGAIASKTVNSTYVHRNTKVFEYNDPAQGNYPKDCTMRQVYSGGGGNTVYTEYRIECPGDVVNVGVAKTWTNNSYYSCSFTANPSNAYLVQGSCDNWRVYK